MADNFVTDPGAAGAEFVSREVSHSGDTVQLSGAFIMGIAGTEGAYTAVAINGDATNGLDVDVTRVSGTVTVANGGTFAVQEDGDALTSLQLIDNPVFVDDAAFALASSSVSMAGAIRDDSLSALAAAEGDAVPLRVGSTGALHVIVNGTVTVGSHDVTNAGTFVVQEDGDALTALQLIDDPIFADDAAFSLTSSKTMVAGGIRDDNLSTLAAAEGDVIPPRYDSVGRLHVRSHVFDPGTIDGFGHLLTNEAINQVEIQFFRDTPANLLTVSVAGGGATSQVGGSGRFETSTAGTANAKGVTDLTTSYRSASEVFVYFSILFTTPTDGNGFQRIGLYDDDNGVFIGFEGETFGASIRNATSDTQVAKASFSEDTLTGAVGSFFTRDGSPEAIDLTKENVFRVRFGWLGSAPIFFEVLSPDDCWVTFHTIRQPNNAVIASMENPDLPITVHVSKAGADGTNLIMLTNCWAAGVTSGALPLDETLTDANLAKVVRTIIAGKNPGGDYVNVTTTTAGNLKTSLQEISDGLDIGAGNADSETQRVSISTDDVNLAALNAGQLPDGHAVAATLDAETTKIIGSVIPVAAATGGMSFDMLALAAEDNDKVIKGSAGTLYYISVQSIDATPVYLKLFDAASITPGTTVADLQFMCPANTTAANGAGIVLNFSTGIEFATGIVALIATGIALDDNTAVSANEVVVTLGFE